MTAIEVTLADDGDDDGDEDDDDRMASPESQAMGPEREARGLVAAGPDAALR